LYYFGQWICGKDEKLDLKPVLLPFQELMYKSGELFSETGKSKLPPIEIEFKNPDVRACSQDVFETLFGGNGSGISKTFGIRLYCAFKDIFYISFDGV
jgi:hypothetical protein